MKLAPLLILCTHMHPCFAPRPQTWQVIDGDMVNFFVLYCIDDHESAHAIEREGPSSACPARSVVRTL